MYIQITVWGVILTVSSLIGVAFLVRNIYQKEIYNMDDLLSMIKALATDWAFLIVAAILVLVMKSHMNSLGEFATTWILGPVFLLAIFTAVVLILMGVFFWMFRSDQSVDDNSQYTGQVNRVDNNPARR